MDTEYETCLISHFWRLEILDGSLIFGKFASPRNRLFSDRNVNLSDLLYFISSALQI